MSSFLRGKLSESDISPTDSRDISASDLREAASAERSCAPPDDDESIHLQALAQALAARALLTRDVKEERRKMKAAAKRDSDIAQDTLSWRRWAFTNALNVLRRLSGGDGLPRILSKWDEYCHTKVVLKLCLRGIPTSIRGEGQYLVFTL